jgi:hypothetical protein
MSPALTAHGPKALYAVSPGAQLAAVQGFPSNPAWSPPVQRRPYAPVLASTAGYAEKVRSQFLSLRQLISACVRECPNQRPTSPYFAGFFDGRDFKEEDERPSEGLENAFFSRALYHLRAVWVQKFRANQEHMLHRAPAHFESFFANR